MAKVTEICAQKEGKVLVICDFSPPRSGDASSLEQASMLESDLICVAYNPGKSVRVDSEVAAFKIRESTGTDVIFNLATRDINKLALQTKLLGAQMLDLENVIIVKGDSFTPKELENIKNVSDFTPTGFIEAISSLNQGTDYKGLKLRAPTDFCIGASIDLAKGIEQEARLTNKKSEAGAHFFITQPIYDTEAVSKFNSAYANVSGNELAQPIFWGVQVLQKDGVIFNDVPETIIQDLEKGRSGVDVALQQLEALIKAGVRRIYLVPPILKGGARDYEAARKVLDALKK